MISTTAAPELGKAQQAAALKAAREQRKNAARRAARAAAKTPTPIREDVEVEAPVQQPAVEETPAPEPTVEETPAETIPIADEPGADQQLSEETPIEEPPAPVAEEPPAPVAVEPPAPVAVEPETPAQPPLLPEAPLTIASIEIPLGALPDDDALIGPPPSRELVEAIRAVGVLVPISVVARPTRKHAPGGYDVLAGRRRIKAARLIGLERIPAVVVETPDQGPLPDALTIQLQQQKQNPATELAAIERLVAQGYDESAIARATGMAVPAIRARLRFGRLVPDLRAAFESGTISTHVAERSARLSVAQQHGLVAVLHENGRLISTDVHEANAARARDSLAALPLGDLDAMPDGLDLPDDLGLTPPPAPPTGAPVMDRETAAAAEIAVDLLRDLLAVIDDAWSKAGADASEQPPAAKRARLFLGEYDRA